MELPRIIGLTGKKFCGKDTIANYFVDKYGYIKIAFADVLKDVCKIIFNLTDEQLNTDKKEIIDERWTVTPRQIMQFIGTDLFRNQLQLLIPFVKEDIWILCVRNKLLDTTKKFIISDVRFENELNMIKELSGKIINIDRKTEYDDKHISETLNLYYDYKIINDKSIDELYVKCNNIFV